MLVFRECLMENFVMIFHFISIPSILSQTFRRFKRNEHTKPFVKSPNGNGLPLANSNKGGIPKMMQKTPMYKRCLWLLVALMLMALPALSLAADHLVVTGGSLNLREEASLESKVLGQYPNGTWMIVLEKGETWSKVQVGQKTGFVMSKYLTDSTKEATLYVRTNTGIGLNLRNAPSLEGDILTSYKPGTKVTVLARGNGWHKVSVNDEVGYMASRYLFASASGSTGDSQTSYPKTGVVNNPVSTQVLLLRETASTDARVLGYYKNGVSVTLLGESGDFYKVTVDGKNGYMMKKYIKVSSSAVTPSFPEAPFEATLKNPNGGSVVNFRSAPGLNSSIIKAYPVGTKITVLEAGQDWSKVQIDGVDGYVSSYFFKF